MIEFKSDRIEQLQDEIAKSLGLRHRAPPARALRAKAPRRLIDSIGRAGSSADVLTKLPARVKHPRAKGLSKGRLKPMA